MFILDCSREYVLRDPTYTRMKEEDGEFEQPRSGINACKRTRDIVTWQLYVVKNCKVTNLRILL